VNYFSRSDPMNLKKDDCFEKPSRISNPPRGFREIFRYMGPAWVFTASQIGGGEALSVPIVAAFLGLEGLWLIPVVAFTKIFGQYYLVRYGVITGTTFLEAVWQRKLLRWLFYWIMFGGIVYAIGLTGHLSETAGTFNNLLPISLDFWIIATLLIGFVIVITRSYALVEKIETFLLWPFLLMITIVAVLVWPSLGELVSGFTPSLPGTVETMGGGGWFIVALMFGWIGAGFGPTVSYIYFAKDKLLGMFEHERKINTKDLTNQEIENIKGWRDLVLWQNIISSILLAIFSTMIWIASASTLHKMGIRPSGFEVVPQMASIFTAIYGDWSSTLFLVSVMAALFSSIIGPLYGMSRLWEEGFGVHGVYRKYNLKSKWTFRGSVIIFAAIPLLLSLSTEKPLYLFSLSGILFAPLIGTIYISAILMSFLDVDKRLHPKRWWAISLGFFASIMSILSSIIELV